jgi:hypothetical protein
MMEFSASTIVTLAEKYRQIPKTVPNRNTRAAAKNEKQELEDKDEKTEDRRRKTLHYGRFKFTATNRHMAGPLRSPQIFFRCAPENFAMRQPVGGNKLAH